MGSYQQNIYFDRRYPQSQPQQVVSGTNQLRQFPSSTTYQRPNHPGALQYSNRPQYGQYTQLDSHPLERDLSSSSWTSQYSAGSPSSGYASSPTASSPSGRLPDPNNALFCLFPDCQHVSARKADLERHIMAKHMPERRTLVDCPEPGCPRRGVHGFPRADKLRDHLREVHKLAIAKRTQGQGRRTAS